MASTPSAATIQKTAARLLGFELRDPQLRAVRAVLSGRDTLALLPTGAGKSAIYQVAGALIPGPTVVVSPLIALQQDQVASLADTGLGAVGHNSAASAAERREAMADLADGDLEFLFVAPEQFASTETMERLKAAKPSLFVVDEAHCVSTWGHDFRPDYRRIDAALAELGHPPVLALTATAAPPVRREIVETLGLEDAAVIVGGFDRPELDLTVRRFTEEEAKRRALLEAATEVSGSGIVYAATRKRVEELVDALRDAGLGGVEGYHAGLAKGRREAAHEAFTAGECRIMVATTAFGMGIDKPDVRFVWHYDVADSIDSYYQEIGRAGRDGDPAEIVLFWRAEDLGLRRFFAAGEIPAEVFEQVAGIVAADGALPVADLAARTELSDTRLTAVLNRLSEAGVVVVDGDSVRVVTSDVDAGVAQAAAAEHAHGELVRSRVEMMRAYAETPGCRREFLLTYFGETFSGPCGGCDNCRDTEAVAEAAAEADPDAPYPPGCAVEHPEWGRGSVLRIEDGERLVVLFDTVGYKTLSLAVVTDSDLLARR
ncbi:RecQ family ATP-dependent DNA helicase [Sporichthya polymorpha]|uniref:RecQ family ATP-dependent DNA helicase n=1 Tax=Sporichthya polymorpha TaxID=35751 RepID=UPI000379A746|nr:RecQ family ATP-dependent DNA helicase [Sporichthya polymorpha]